MRPSKVVTPRLAGPGADANPIAGKRGASSDAIRAAFEAWSIGEGSIYDLLDADAEIIIPGISPHCGAYRKDAFLREIASPFGARFSSPPVPRLRRLWATGDSVAVMADATGTTRDGRSYANTYVFVFEMAGQRVTKVTEFLDMSAFNDVWDRVAPGAADAR